MSRDRSVLTNSTIRLSDDIGIQSELSLSPSAVAALYAFGYNSGTSSIAISDERLGSSAWRDLIMPTANRWKESINSQNCTPNTTRNMYFTQELRLQRGAYDLDGSGSTAVWDYSSGSVSVDVNKNLRVSVSTMCRVDNNGNYYRTYKPGILN